MPLMPRGDVWKTMLVGSVGLSSPMRRGIGHE
jgi:hypothetical protein